MDKNLKKDFIRKIKIIVEFSILFILKKDRKLRLYINYRKLNTIIIKDKYPLLNIRKLQNYLIRAKWFTKLDLYKIYNLIRIKKRDKWKTVLKHNMESISIKLYYLG